MPRRSEPPRSDAELPLDLLARQCPAPRLLLISEVLAWNTSDFTFSGSQPMISATSAWELSCSSASSSASRWSAGRPARSREKVAQVGTAGDLLGEPGVRGLLVAQLLSRPSNAKHADALIAGDAVKPRPYAEVAAASQHVPVGVGEHDLDGVLGLVVRAQHVAAVGEEWRWYRSHSRAKAASFPARTRADEALVRGRCVQTPRGLASLQVVA